MKEKKNTFLDAAVILFFLTFVNKLLGFVKSMTIASIYGATIQTDAYYVAEGLMQNVLISISEALAFHSCRYILESGRRTEKTPAGLQAVL